MIIDPPLSQVVKESQYQNTQEVEFLNNNKNKTVLIYCTLNVYAMKYGIKCMWEKWAHLDFQILKVRRHCWGSKLFCGSPCRRELVHKQM